MEKNDAERSNGGTVDIETESMNRKENARRSNGNNPAHMNDTGRSHGSNGAGAIDTNDAGFRGRATSSSDFTMTPASRNLPSILKYFDVSDEEEEEEEEEEAPKVTATKELASGTSSGATPRDHRLQERGQNDVEAAAAVAVASVEEGVKRGGDRRAAVEANGGTVGIAVASAVGGNGVKKSTVVAGAADVRGTVPSALHPSIFSETPIEDEDELADDVSLDEFMDASRATLHPSAEPPETPRVGEEEEEEEGKRRRRGKRQEILRRAW